MRILCLSLLLTVFYGITAASTTPTALSLNTKNIPSTTITTGSGIRWIHLDSPTENITVEFSLSTKGKSIQLVLAGPEVETLTTWWGYYSTTRYILSANPNINNNKIRPGSWIKYTSTADTRTMKKCRINVNNGLFKIEYMKSDNRWHTAVQARSALTKFTRVGFSSVHKTSIIESGIITYQAGDPAIKEALSQLTINKNALLEEIAAAKTQERLDELKAQIPILLKETTFKAIMTSKGASEKVAEYTKAVTAVHAAIDATSKDLPFQKLLPPPPAAPPGRVTHVVQWNRAAEGSGEFGKNLCIQFAATIPKDFRLRLAYKKPGAGSLIIANNVEFYAKYNQNAYQIRIVYDGKAQVISSTKQNDLPSDKRWYLITIIDDHLGLYYYEPTTKKYIPVISGNYPALTTRVGSFALYSFVSISSTFYNVADLSFVKIVSPADKEKIAQSAREYIARISALSRQEIAALSDDDIKESINFDSLAKQADTDFANKIWDEGKAARDFHLKSFPPHPRGTERTYTNITLPLSPHSDAFIARFFAASPGGTFTFHVDAINNGKNERLAFQFHKDKVMVTAAYANSAGTYDGSAQDGLEYFNFGTQFKNMGGIGTLTWYEIICIKGTITINATKVDDSGKVLAQGSITRTGSIFNQSSSAPDPFSKSTLQKSTSLEYQTSSFWIGHKNYTITDFSITPFPLDANTVKTDYIDSSALIEPFVARVATYTKWLKEQPRATALTLTPTTIGTIAVINAKEAFDALISSGMTTEEADAVVAKELKPITEYITKYHAAEKIITDLTASANAIILKDPIASAEQAEKELNVQAAVDALTAAGMMADIARVQQVLSGMKEALQRRQLEKTADDLLTALKAKADTFITTKINTARDDAQLQALALDDIAAVEKAFTAAKKDFAPVTALKTKIETARVAQKEKILQADEALSGFTPTTDEDIYGFSVDDLEVLDAAKVDADLNYTTLKEILTAANKTSELVELEAARTRINATATERRTLVAGADKLLGTLQEKAVRLAADATTAENVQTRSDSNSKGMPAPLAATEITLVTDALTKAGLKTGGAALAANAVLTAIEEGKNRLTGIASQKLIDLQKEAENLRLKMAQAKDTAELDTLALKKAQEARDALAAAGKSDTDVSALVSNINLEIKELKDGFSDAAQAQWRAFVRQKDSLLKGIAAMDIAALATAALTGSEDVKDSLETAGDDPSKVDKAEAEVTKLKEDREKALNNKANEEVAALEKRVDLLVENVATLHEPQLGATTLSDLTSVTKALKEAGRPETILEEQQLRVGNAIEKQQEALRTKAADLLATLTKEVGAITTKTIPTLTTKKEVDLLIAPGKSAATAAQLHAGNGKEGTDKVEAQAIQLQTAKENHIIALRKKATDAVVALSEKTDELIKPINEDKVNEADLATITLPANLITNVKTLLSNVDEPDSTQGYIDRLDAAIKGRRARLSGDANAQVDAITKQIPGLLLAIEKMYEPAISSAALQGITQARTALQAAGKPEDKIDEAVKTISDAVTIRQKNLTDAAQKALENLEKQTRDVEAATLAMNAAALTGVKLKGTDTAIATLTQSGASNAAETIATYQERVTTAIGTQTTKLNNAASAAIADLTKQAGEWEAKIKNMMHAEFSSAKLGNVSQAEESLAAAGQPTSDITAQKKRIPTALNARQLILDKEATDALNALKTQLKRKSDAINAANNGAGMTYAELAEIDLENTTVVGTAQTNAGGTTNNVIVIINQFRSAKANQQSKLTMRSHAKFNALKEEIQGHLDTIASATITEATLAQIEAAGTQKAQTATTTAYTNAGRDDQLSEITDEAAKMPAAIKAKRAELTGDANALLEAFEDTADDIIASVTKKTEPELSETKLPDTQKLISTLNTAGMGSEKTVITEKQTELTTAITNRKKELTTAAENVVNKLKETVTTLIDAIQKMVWDDLDTEKTELTGIEPVEKALDHAGLKRAPIEELEKLILKTIEDQRITLKGEATGTLIALQGEIDGLVGGTETMDDADLDAITLTKEEVARTARKHAGFKDSAPIDVQVKRLEDAIARQRTELAKERALAKLNALRIAAGDLKTAIASMEEEQLAGAVLTGSTAIEAELRELSLDAQADEVTRLEQQVATAVGTRRDMLAQAEELRLAQEAAIAKLNAMEKETNGYLNTITEMTTEQLEKASLNATDALKNELTEAKLVARVGDIDGFIEQINNAKTKRRKKIAQDAANAQLKELQEAARSFVDNFNTAESIDKLKALKAQATLSFANAEEVKKALASEVTDLAEKTSLVDSAISQAMDAHNNRRDTLLKDAAGVALNELKAQAAEKTGQAIDAKKIEALPQPILDNIDTVKAALSTAEGFDPSDVDTILADLKSLVEKRTEEIKAAELKRRQDAAREQFKAFKENAENVMSAITEAGEDEIGTLTLGDTASLIQTLTDAQLSKEAVATETLITQFNTLIKEQADRLAAERAERERIAVEKERKAREKAEAIARAAKEEAERKAAIIAKREAELKKRLARMRYANDEARKGGIQSPSALNQDRTITQSSIRSNFFAVSFYAQEKFTVNMQYTKKTQGVYELSHAPGTATLQRRATSGPVAIEGTTKATPPTGTAVYYRLEVFYGRFHLMYYDTAEKQYKTILSTIDYDTDNEANIYEVRFGLKDESNRPAANSLTIASTAPIYSLLWQPLTKETFDTTKEPVRAVEPVEPTTPEVAPEAPQPEPEAETVTPEPTVPVTPTVPTEPKKMITPAPPETTAIPEPDNTLPDPVDDLGDIDNFDIDLELPEPEVTTPAPTTPVTPTTPTESIATTEAETILPENVDNLGDIDDLDTDLELPEPEVTTPEPMAPVTPTAPTESIATTEAETTLPDDVDNLGDIDDLDTNLELPEPEITTPEPTASVTPTTPTESIATTEAETILPENVDNLGDIDDFDTDLELPESEVTAPEAMVPTPAPAETPVAPAPAQWRYLKQATIDGKSGKKLFIQPQGDIPVVIELKDKDGNTQLLTITIEGLFYTGPDGGKAQLLGSGSDNEEGVELEVDEGISQTFAITTKESSYLGNTSLQIFVERFDNGKSVAKIDTGLKTDDPNDDTVLQPLTQFKLTGGTQISEEQAGTIKAPAVKEEVKAVGGVVNAPVTFNALKTYSAKASSGRR